MQVREQLKRVAGLRSAVHLARRITASHHTKLRAQIDLRAAQRALLTSHSTLPAEKQLLTDVSLQLDANDGMYTAGEGFHYLCVGLSAMRCINASLNHAGIKVRSILDFPSGSGRVLRFLRVGYPDAEIFAAELDHNAMAFCERAFKVSTGASDQDLGKVSLPRTFDLIWSGSLLTHLDARRASEALYLFYRHLAPGGLCLFTMHGRTSIDWLKNGDETYGLSETSRQTVLSNVACTGYGYADYSPDSNFGISVATYSYILEMASAVGDWTLSSFLERAWSGHHDVYGFIKGPQRPPLIIDARQPAPPKLKGRWPVEF